MSYKSIIVYESDIEHLINSIAEQYKYSLVDNEILIKLRPRLLSIEKKIPYLQLLQQFNMPNLRIKVIMKQEYSPFGVTESINSVEIQLSYFVSELSAESTKKQLKEVLSRVYQLAENSIIDVEIEKDSGSFKMIGGAESTALLNPLRR